MFNKNKKVNLVFWAFQLGGWGFLALANNWSKLVYLDNGNGLYHFFEGVIFLFFGLLISYFFYNYER